MAMSLVVAGKHPTSEITSGVSPINDFPGHNTTEWKTVTCLDWPELGSKCK